MQVLLRLFLTGPCESCPFGLVSMSGKGRKHLAEQGLWSFCYCVTFSVTETPSLSKESLYCLLPLLASFQGAGKCLEAHLQLSFHRSTRLANNIIPLLERCSLKALIFCDSLSHDQERCRGYDHITSF